MTDRHSVAVFGNGDGVQRAIAVAFANFGCPAIALATLVPDQDGEYGVHSIANELWALGTEQCVGLTDISDADSVDAFVAEAVQQCGPLAALIAVFEPPQGGATLLLMPGSHGIPRTIFVTNGDVVRAVVAGEPPESLTVLAGDRGEQGTVSHADGNEQAVADTVRKLVFRD